MPKHVKLRTNTKVLLGAYLVCKLYETHPNGGKLRLLVDDWKIEDADIEAALARNLDAEELACANALKDMTRYERYSALWFAEDAQQGAPA